VCPTRRGSRCRGTGSGRAGRRGRRRRATLPAGCRRAWPRRRVSRDECSRPQELKAARGGLRGGASRARTGDLLTASQTLSQLSYGPVEVPAKCSREIEVVRPTYPEPLVASGGRRGGRRDADGRRRRPEAGGTIGRPRRSKQRSDRPPPPNTWRDENVAIAPTRAAGDHRDVAPSYRPLRLDTQERQLRVNIRSYRSPSAIGTKTLTPSLRARCAIAVSAIDPF
jgi:hypothetical protein